MGLYLATSSKRGAEGGEGYIGSNIHLNIFLKPSFFNKVVPSNRATLPDDMQHLSLSTAAATALLPSPPAAPNLTSPEYGGSSSSSGLTHLTRSLSLRTGNVINHGGKFSLSLATKIGTQTESYGSETLC